MNLTAALNPIALPPQVSADASASVALPMSRGGEVGNSGVGFDAALAAVTAAQGDQRDADPKTIEDAARQLVATSFFKPLFAQMRDSAFKSERFHGGLGEDAFTAQLDEVLSDRMAQRGDWALVDAVVRQLTPTPGSFQTHPPAPNRALDLKA
jgi:Rod binding domain-containing protein